VSRDRYPVAVVGGLVIYAAVAYWGWASGGPWRLALVCVPLLSAALVWAMLRLGRRWRDRDEERRG
jgi:membrane protein implicated in regulation of membrane protease activity